MEVVLIYRGLAVFVGQRPHLGLDGVLLGLFLAIYAWLTYGLPSIKRRIMLFSAYYFYYYLSCLSLTLRQVPPLLDSRNWLLICISGPGPGFLWWRYWSPAP